jgi:hypothetical protein
MLVAADSQVIAHRSLQWQHDQRHSERSVQALDR